MKRCLKACDNTGGQYYCSRELGHTGPCAAIPLAFDVEEIFVSAVHLGKRCREAYYRSIDGHATNEEWDSLSEDEKTAWTNAAFAVRGL